MSTSKPRAASVALVVLAGLTGSAVASAATATADGDSRSKGSGHAKNVIYLLGDGMGRTHVTAARERYYGADGHLVMETLGSTGQVSTYSVNKKSGQPGKPDFSRLRHGLGVCSHRVGVRRQDLQRSSRRRRQGQDRPHVDGAGQDDGYRTGNVSTAEITDADTGRADEPCLGSRVPGTVVLRGCLPGPRRHGRSASHLRRPGDPDRGPDRPQRHR